MTGFRRNNRYGVGKSYFDSSSSLEDETLSLINSLDVANAIYGSGEDGSVTLDGSSAVAGMSPSSQIYTMTRDMFFYNLTIGPSVHLKTSGYRLFVKNTLTLSGESRIGFTEGFSTPGSIMQGGSVSEAVTNSLGGSTTHRSATEPSPESGGSSYYRQPIQAVRGYSITAGVAAPTFLRGGAGGQSGEGGGIVILSARYIVVESGNAYISAPGTPGQSGGGGGVVIIISSNSVMNSAVSVDVSGGLNASDGTFIYSQVV
jgi:hypothetical protein